ncbi:ABC-type antimicrobial peptide transport system permease subunit [Marinilabilia salmonicolor]|jgi:ABC-type antimicrobial peptide transport system permease subunit|uniref:ABC transporter permease n=1 Tax=Marinilabilia salmonicolor TaxID=989 RepID=UPI000D071F4A|nr:ABC transporter permease [Marinilabilia salmonicolor]PRZ00559.1 ABC-type antimicrobial peptide transport system permease subunit [Marinilabilia salmonicolor]
MRILNYIKISLRTLFLHRGFSLLTLLGLSVGIAMSIFVLEYVFFQFSFDKHFDRYQDMYRVVTSGNMENEQVDAALSPMVLASRLKQYPEVESATRIVDVGEVPVRSDFASSYESEILYADSAFFDVFSTSFLLGGPQKTFPDSSCVIISRAAASRLFGDRNPIGQELRFDQDDTYIVKGVFEDVPQNSHLQYDFVLPFSVMEQQLRNYYGDSFSRMIESWFSLVCYVYVKMEPGADVHKLEGAFADEIKAEMEEEDMAIFSGERKTNLHFSFQPLHHIYLFSSQDFEIGKTTNKAYVFIFLGVAFFILLVTAFNFMNLTTARALDRAREAGVRRLFGARRFHLAGQFISEAVLFSLVALFFGLVLVELLLPVFNKLFLVEFFDRSYRQSLDFPLVLTVTLAVGLLSGIYPAFVFSRIKAFHLQSGYRRFSAYPGLWVRGLLVMTQVFVAVFVSTAAVGMYRQLSYVNKKDPGFDIDQVGILERAGHLGSKSETMYREIENLDITEDVSRLYFKPGEPVTIMSFSNTEDSSQLFLFEVYPVDSSFFHTIGVKAEKGTEHLFGSGDIVVNRQAAQMLGNDVIGRKIYTVAREAGDRMEFGIQGVVPDIHFSGWKHSLRPAVYIYAGPEEKLTSLLIRFKKGQWPQTHQLLNDLWGQSKTGIPFKAVSFRQKNRDFYSEDYRYMSLAWAFAVLVIIIATLGMTGLVSFLLATRQQELYLRKITGFPDFHNIRILFSGFFLFVLLGVLMAFPVSGSMLSDWSQAFVVRYEVDYFCFVLPALLMLLLAGVLVFLGARRLLNKISLHQF